MHTHPVSSPKHADGTAATPKTLVAGAYLALRRDIIEGRLAPGSRLRAEHLKQDYEVGAGTLREALALLAADSLVSIQGQRGYRVAEMSFLDFEDITETRIVMECHALRSSIRNGDGGWKAELEAAFHALCLAENGLRQSGADAFEQWEAANKRFHEALIAGCVSAWTKHFLRILYRQAERYRRLLLANRPISRDVQDEHLAIFEAAIARKETVACDLLSEHIRHSLDIYRGYEK